jgi:sarcosine oxidase delta subunit
LQRFLNEEISKPEILDMVCAMRSYENIKANNEEWQKSDGCEVGFQLMTDTVNAASKQNRKEGWRMRVKFTLPSGVHK